MSNPPVETGPSDEKLRESILTDDELRLCEILHPGEVRVLASGRYHARVQAQTFFLDFTLNKESREGRSFEVNTHGIPLDTIPEALWDLVWHRAAEAVLAVRKGHMEYRRNRSMQNTATAA